jgi:CHASE3 domain sensor protein
MSRWNPEHWKKYSKEENEELRKHLQRYGKANRDYQQWIRELDTVIPGQQPNQARISDLPDNIA